MKKAEKEPSKINAAPVKGGRKTDPLTPEELREMYVMVKEIYHHLGLDCHKIASMKSIQEQARKDVLKWKERDARKKERPEKKE